MHLSAVHTGILRAGDDLVGKILQESSLEDGDIVVISSKAAATVEDAFIDLSLLEVTPEAEAWSAKLTYAEPNPPFRQAVLNETKRLNGHVVEGCPIAMLTELRPDGFPVGTLLVPNAGLDLSNVPKGYALGWPLDPVASVATLRDELQNKSGKQLGVILSDSGCRPRRLGVTAIALTVAGFDPIQSQVDTQDLFGRALRMTQEAVADQLATAANFLMGNADAAAPAAIIRDHGIPLSDFCGWVGGIEPENDLFKGAL